MTKGVKNQDRDELINSSNYNPTRHRDRAALPTGVPQQLLFLTHDEEQLRAELCERMVKAGAVGEPDGAAVDVLVQSIRHYENLTKQLNADGYVYSDLEGKVAPKVHPTFSAWEKAQKMVMTQLRDFGLTPAGRRKVPISGEKTEKSLDELLDG